MKEVAATQPSNVTVLSADFEKLWRAADIAARDLLFIPARQDRRAGLYVTEPNTSGQWFEPWRHDAITAAQRTQSSLATIRRTIRVKIEKSTDGTFVARPTVFVERYSLTGRRVTNSAGYRTVFQAPDSRSTSGTVESDAGILLPTSYWYPIGNDPTLEAYFAKSMEKQLAKG